ncbi:MAG: hydrogenase maturation nickel metallochaperone HypA [Desulfatiglandaceae bacterium]
MHEMSIAHSLIEIVKEEMIKNDVRMLKAVRVHIGQMSAIVPESLSFCFEVMTSGTELEGTRLLMEIIPLEGVCTDCERAFEIQDFVFLCPQCGSRNIQTIAGRDLSIVEMEVES